MPCRNVVERSALVNESIGKTISRPVRAFGPVADGVSRGDTALTQELCYPLQTLGIEVESVVNLRAESALNLLRELRQSVIVAYGTLQSFAQGVPQVLQGERLGALRSQLIGRPEIIYRAGISNCGLMPHGDGFLGVVKNNTYNFCCQHGIDVDYGPRHWPVRSSLLQVELDRSFAVQKVSKLTLRENGRVLDDPDDLHEDARLVRVGDQVWCSMNLVPKARMSKALPRVGRLDPASAALEVVTLKMPKVRLPEKNWIPFSHEGRLYIQYSVNPHVVLRIDERNGSVLERHSTFFVSPYVGFPGPFFRGGAPLIPFEDVYLGVAHSVVFSNGERDYRTHFYLTDPRPPFAIRWLGAPLKLLRPERIQYVSASLFDAERQRVILSYGMDDCDNLFAAFGSREVRATLKRVH